MTNKIFFISNFSVACVIIASVSTKGLNADVIAYSVTEPNNTGIKSILIAEIPKASVTIEPVTSRICFIFKVFVASDIFFRAIPKGINAILIITIAIEPSAIKGNTAGIPNAATMSPNKIVVVAIMATCLNVTPFVALVILPSAIPNSSRDKLIIAIRIAPCITCFFAFDSILKVNMLIVTTPNTTSDPSNALMAFFAIEDSNKDVIVISAVNPVRMIAAPTALFIFFLFLESFLPIGIIKSTITLNAIAPNIAGIATTVAMVKNIDDTNKLPTRVVIFFAASAPFSIVFLFLESFLAKGNILLSNIESIVSMPPFANFAQSNVKNNFRIALFKDDISSLRFLADLLPSSIIFLFFCNDMDIDNIEFSPINIFFNFCIVSFLMILLSFQLTLCNAFIISGVEPISLMMLFRSFSSIFKSSFAFLNSSDIFLIFLFAMRISKNEMVLSLLNASTRAAIPPPLLCFSMFFTIAFATLSEALSLNFTTPALVPFPCFTIAFSRLIIAFLMPFVSSSISLTCF